MIMKSGVQKELMVMFGEEKCRLLFLKKDIYIKINNSGLNDK